MENPLEVLKNSPAIEELMKTREGRNLAERLLRLSNELNLMPDSEKLRFTNEFGSAFESSLNQLLPHQPASEDPQSTDNWTESCFICCVIVFFASMYL